MKRILFLLILLAVFVPLFAGLTIEGTLPDESMAALRLALEDNLHGRFGGDVLAVVGMEDGTGLVTLSLMLGEKKLETKVAPQFLGQEVEAMLSYEELLFASQPRLDYIYGTSFSAFLPEETGNGTLFRAYDNEGATRALLVVSGRYGEAALLKPLAVDKAKPGLALEEVSPLRLRSSFWYKVSGGRALLDLSLSRSTSLLYPVVPYASLTVALGDNPGVSVGVGGEISFNFASLWSKAPAFLAQSAVVGNVEGDLWLEQGGLRCDGRYAISFETMFGGNHTFRVGVGELGYNSLAVMVGGGLRIL